MSETENCDSADAAQILWVTVAIMFEITEFGKQSISSNEIQAVLFGQIPNTKHRKAENTLKKPSVNKFIVFFFYKENTSFCINTRVLKRG